MWIIGTLTSLALIALLLLDAFETILQPRRVTHRFRFARLFYRNTWKLWRAVGLWMRPGKRREAYLSIFGPLSLLGLFATWVIGLILGFGLLHASLGTTVQAPEERATVLTYLYLSGTTFFTLGYGDVIPMTALGRGLTVAEAGLGFAFLAVIVGYLPVLYQAFSRREVAISLLDARGGSPPSAAQLLVRLARAGHLATLDSFLVEWERWSAELLESHLSFPVLSYFRSQHDNQSWLAALTCMLDTCAVLIAEVKSHSSYQAQLTFAMARHAAVDLALVLKTPPRAPDADRLPDDARQRLRDLLRQSGLDLHTGPAVDARFTELRGMYEPFLAALSQRFLFPLPPFIPDDDSPDNWQRSAWMNRTPGIGSLPLAEVDDAHFE